MAWETVFIDGFDHYTTSEIGKKWSDVGAGTINSTIFRNSGKSIRGAGAATFVSAKRLPTSVKNVLVGFGMYVDSAPVAATIGSSYSSALLLGSTLGGAADQCGLALLSDSKLHAFRGTVSAGGSGSVTGTDLGAAANTVPVGQWFYVEARVFVHDTDGQIEVRVNGVVEVNLSGIDTRSSTTVDTLNVVALRHCAGLSGATYFDDLYIRTSSASTAESGGFLGDVRIKPLYPDADGTYAQMTPSSGSAHYSLVDETTPGTTDYVSSSTAGHKDTYSFENFSDSGSIKAVQLNVYAAKDDAGFRGIDPMVKSGATEDFGTSQALSVTVAYKTKVWEKNPNTSNDWSQSEVNAAEFGQRISADI